MYLVIDLNKAIPESPRSADQNLRAREISRRASGVKSGRHAAETQRANDRHTERRGRSQAAVAGRQAAAGTSGAPSVLDRAQRIADEAHTSQAPQQTAARGVHTATTGSALGRVATGTARAMRWEQPVAVARSRNQRNQMKPETAKSLRLVISL